MYDVSTLDFAQVCAVFIKLAERSKQYFTECPVVNSRK